MNQPVINPLANNFVPNVPSNTNTINNNNPTSPPGVDPINIQRNWSTSLMDVLADEESCWWSTWCCCIIAGRNAESFGLGSSMSITKHVIMVTCTCLILSILGLGGLSLLLIIFFYCLFAYNQGQIRSQIRDKLNILIGSSSGDCFLHCCLPCCAVAQESREAKINQSKLLDYCSGQPLEELAPPTPVNTGSYFSNENIDEDEREGGDHLNSFSLSSSNTSSNSSSTYFSLFSPSTIASSYSSLSITSKLLVKLWIGFVFLVILILSLSSPLNILLFLFIFLEPIIILSILYYPRKKFVQYDYIVKLFSVGFFMSTTQSLIFEYLLQAILGLIIIIYFLLVDPSALDSITNDEGDPSTNMIGSSSFSSFSSLFYNILNKFSTSNNDSSFTDNSSASIGNLLLEYRKSFAFTFIKFVHSCSLRFSSFFTESSIDFSFQYNPFLKSSTYYSGDISSFDILQDTSEGGGEETEEDDLMSFIPKDKLKDHIFILIFALFFMSFVIAAGVEETMKHFVVRCCRFPSSLKDPRTILVYLVAGSLGFATAENIEYVFASASASSTTAASVAFTNGLFVMFIRMIMPIHFFCSVLQAVSLSHFVIRGEPVSLFKVLLNAIILHGSFDFFLFATAAFSVLYDIKSNVFDAFSIIIPISMSIGGGIWAYKSYTAVEANYRNSWRIVENDDESGVV